MEALGRELGFAHIAYGMNADDRRDYRPGQRAAEEHEVLAPLAEAGLTKADVRMLARAAGYTLWDRPAAPCLSSRVEYGREVTREVLAQVERAEESMRRLGFREFRVRHHGELARVEIARAEMPRALAMEIMDAVTAALRQAGYQYVTLDTAGFRSGSLNALLPAEVPAPRRVGVLSAWPVILTELAGRPLGYIALATRYDKNTPQTTITPKNR